MVSKVNFSKEYIKIKLLKNIFALKFFFHLFVFVFLKRSIRSWISIKLFKTLLTSCFVLSLVDVGDILAKCTLIV